MTYDMNDECIDMQRGAHCGVGRDQLNSTFRSRVSEKPIVPARLRGGWGLAGAGAGVPQRPVTVMFV